MKTDEIISIIFISLSILFYEGTHHLGYTSAIFPKAMAMALLIFSIALFFVSLFNKGGIYVKEKIVIKSNDVAYLTAVIFISFIWIFTMQIVGFITTSVISLTLMTEILTTKRPIRFKEVAYTILVYLLLSGGIWVALSKFLAVPLPRGILI